MSDDIWQEPTAKVWVRHVLDEMVPMLDSSSVVLSIVPGGPHGEGDVKFWVELGASIMLDKPIIFIAIGDRPVPKRLALVADEIVRCPDGVNLASSQAIADAVQRVMNR